MKYRLLLASAAALTFAAPAISQSDPSASAPAADAATAPAPADAAATPAPDTAAAPAAADSAATTPAPADASAASTPPAAATEPATAPAATAAATPAPDPAKAQAADQLIAQGWAKYDPQNTGQLTPLAFGEWVMAAQGNDLSAQIKKSQTGKAAGLPATKVLNATAAEFSKADTDKNRTVSRDELKAYLAG